MASKRTADVQLGPDRADNPLYSIGPGGPRNTRSQGRHLCGRVQSAGLESSKDYRNCVRAIQRINSVTLRPPSICACRAQRALLGIEVLLQMDNLIYSAEQRLGSVIL